MRKAPVLAAAATLMLVSETAMGVATYGWMRFEVNGSSIVAWDEIKDGFRLDIVVGSDDPLGMGSFDARLAGDPRFAFDAVGAANYDTAQNWSTAEYGFLAQPAGHLPTSYIGDICDWPSYAQNGRAAWVRFSNVPPRDSYVIGIYADWAFLTDSDFTDLAYGTPQFRFTPLTILLPEPTAISLLALGVFAVNRRRR